MNNRFDSIQLVPEQWEWQHHDAHVWQAIPNAASPQHRDKLFMLAAPGANSRRSRPFSQVPAGMKAEAPSRKKTVPFMAFIGLDGSKEGFLEFANTVGHLLIEPIPVAGGEGPVWTSSLDLWIEEHWRFKIAHRLWTALQDPTDKSPAGLVFALPNKTDSRTTVSLVITDATDWETRADFDKTRRLFAAATYPLSMFNLLCDKDGRALAITFTFEINEKTGRLTSRDIVKWCFHWLVNGQLQKYPSFARLNYSEEGSFQQSLWPENLLAAMWMHLYQIVTGERRIVRCVICGRWSDITDEKKGKKPWDRHRDCANSDGVEKHRKLPKIKDMLTTGLSVEEAASRMNVEMATITRWLNEQKEDFAR